MKNASLSGFDKFLWYFSDWFTFWATMLMGRVMP